jgi:starch synthase
MQAQSEGRINDNAVLIHVDAHEDMNQPGILSNSDTDDYWIEEFIMPAVGNGLIGEIYCVTPKFNLTEEPERYISFLGKGVKFHKLYREQLPNFYQETRPVILDIDMDYFAAYVVEGFGHFIYTEIEQSPVELIWMSKGFEGKSKIYTEKELILALKSLLVIVADCLRMKGVEPNVVTIAKSYGYSMFADQLCEDLVRLIEAKLLTPSSSPIVKTERLLNPPALKTVNNSGELEEAYASVWKKTTEMVSNNQAPGLFKKKMFYYITCVIPVSEFPKEMKDRLSVIRESLGKEFTELEFTPEKVLHSTVFVPVYDIPYETQDELEKLESSYLVRKMASEFRTNLLDILSGRGLKYNFEGLNLGPDGAIFVQGHVEDETVFELRRELGERYVDEGRRTPFLHISFGRVIGSIEPEQFRKLYERIKEYREEQFGEVNVSKLLLFSGEVIPTVRFIEAREIEVNYKASSPVEFSIGDQDAAVKDVRRNDVITCVFSEEGKKVIQNEMFMRLKRREGNIPRSKVQVRLDNAIDEFARSYSYQDVVINEYGFTDTERDANVLKSTEEFLKILKMRTNERLTGFAIFSGPSGVGKGTIGSCLAKEFNISFKPFLLYAAGRERRAESRFKNDIEKGSLLFNPLKYVLENLHDVTCGEKVELASFLRQKFNLTDEHEKDLHYILDIDCLPLRCVDIYGLPKRITLTERIGWVEGRIRVFGEFTGVDKIFVSHEELFALQQDKELEIFEVQDYLQAISFKDMQEMMSKDKELTILECSVGMGSKILERFGQDKIPNVFILPFSGKELMLRSSVLQLFSKILTEKWISLLSGIKGIINPTNERIKGIYIGSGPDISTFLLLSNAQEGYFVTREKLGRLENEGIFNLKTLEAFVNDKESDNSVNVGLAGALKGIFSTDKYLNSREFGILPFLIWELIGVGAVGIKVEIDAQIPSICKINFGWKHPAEGEVQSYRTITILTSVDLNDIQKYLPGLGKKFDFCLEKALWLNHQDLETSYREKTLAFLKPNAFVVTDKEEKWLDASIFNGLAYLQIVNSFNQSLGFGHDLFSILKYNLHGITPLGQKEWSEILKVIKCPGIKTTAMEKGFRMFASIVDEKRIAYIDEVIKNFDSFTSYHQAFEFANICIFIAMISDFIPEGSKLNMVECLKLHGRYKVDSYDGISMGVSFDLARALALDALGYLGHESFEDILDSGNYYSDDLIYALNTALVLGRNNSKLSEVLVRIFNSNKIYIPSSYNEAAIKLYKQISERKVELLTDTVALIEVHPTNVCNLNCKGCSYESCHNRERLPFDVSIKRIAELQPAEVRIVGGGEPTLYKDGNRGFSEFIGKLRGALPKAKLTLTTNGTFIPNGDWIREFEWIRISLHGASAEGYANFTGKDFFNMVWANIFDFYLMNANAREIQVSLVYDTANFKEIIGLIRKIWGKFESLRKGNGYIRARLKIVLRPCADDSSPFDPYHNSRLPQFLLMEYKDKLEEFKSNDPEFWKFVCDQANDMLTIPFSGRKAEPVAKCNLVKDYVLMAADGIFYPCCVMAACQRDFNLGFISQGNKELSQRRASLLSYPHVRCFHYCRPQFNDTASRARKIKSQECSSSPLTFAFVSYEMYPYIKVGGLADVMGGLPRALADMGHEVYVFIPKDYRVNEEALNVRDTGIRINGAMIKSSSFHNVQVYLIDSHEFPAIYGNDYIYNINMSIFFSRTVLDTMLTLNINPDIIYTNDWHTALVPIYRKTNYHYNFVGKRVIQMLHNIGPGYQGEFSASEFQRFGLDRKNVFHINGMEHHGKINILKGGSYFADANLTVSPSYAKEIQTYEGGAGLSSVFGHLAWQGKLLGILNGIDTKLWNPAEDKALFVPYNETNLFNKYVNKALLQKRLGLKIEKEIPLVAAIGRITEQKGFNLIVDIAESLIREMGVQLVILGDGPDKGLIYQLTDIAGRHPGLMSANISFDEQLARQIYAGADTLLAPSLWEPCGMIQMYGQRYGTPPIVRVVGGFKDTVIDFNSLTGIGDGFTFTGFNSSELFQVIKRAVGISRHDKASWEKIILNGMRKDNSWNNTAEKHLEICERLLQSSSPVELEKANKQFILEQLEEAFLGEYNRSLTDYSKTIARKQIGDFVLQYNPERGNKRAPDTVITSVKPPDPKETKGFNYIVVDGERKPHMKFFRGQEVGGVPVEIFSQPKPLVKHGHMLLLPRMYELFPQYLTKDTVKVALALTHKIPYEDHMKIAFNSFGAWGSVNHLHLQAIFYENTSDEPAVMPVERYMMDTLQRKDSVRLTSLKDYPVHTFAIEGTYGEELINSVFDIAILLQDENVIHKRQIAHNLLFTKTEQGLSRVYIFPRKFQTPSELGTGVAFFELGGELIALIKEHKDIPTDSKITKAYEDITSLEELVPELKNTNLPEEEFKNLKEKVFKMFIASSPVENKTVSENFHVEIQGDIERGMTKLGEGKQEDALGIFLMAQAKCNEEIFKSFNRIYALQELAPVLSEINSYISDIKDGTVRLNIRLAEVNPQTGEILDTEGVNFLNPTKRVFGIRRCRCLSWMKRVAF